MSSNANTLVDDFDRQWAMEERADVFEYARTHSLTTEEIRRAVLLDQYHRHQQGRALPIEDYLAHWPDLQNDTDWLLELLLEEFGYRQEAGEANASQFLGQLEFDDPALIDRIRSELVSELEASERNVTSSKTPAHIGRFEVQSQLGLGSFGQVFLARDPQLQRLVAIKVASDQVSQKITGNETALAEARSVAAIDHPSIVPVYEFGTDENLGWYIVSKYIGGGMLTDHVDSNVNLETALTWTAEVAEGLCAAHERGVIHRDVKPANILIDENNRACLTDFGLAWSHHRSESGAYVGTPAWMSPEQARGESHLVDARSDIFSLGIVLYELLTGRRPFHADSARVLMQQIAETDVVSPRQWVETIPLTVERVCMKALARRQNDRYENAAELARDLRHIIAENPKATGRESQIVPTGLRAFDESHRDFFLTLLPPPLTVEGIPESISFWEKRCESTDPNTAFRVGLLYGPSGCGKSSLLKAGIIPRLDDSVTVVFVNAGGQLENELTHAIHGRIEKTRVATDVVETMRLLRESTASGKTLVVIDQAEQWMRDLSQRKTLAEVLRQCDGAKLQCLLSVRDDFWMATSQLFRDMDVRLVEDENLRAVELFSTDHARKVLHTLGRAHGRFERGELSDSDQQFLNRCVGGLESEDRIHPIKLALFAEMLKDQPWTTKTLRQLNFDDMGVEFLERAFGEIASPRNRELADDAQKILHRLLPDQSTQIKPQPTDRHTCIGDIPESRFDEIIVKLDQQFHLVNAVDGDTESYQLSHDFMIQPIRSWINKHQRTTWKGWLSVRLTEQSDDWNRQPSTRKLPMFWETIAFATFLERRDFTAKQSRFLSKAYRFQLGFAALMLFVFCGAAWLVYQLNGRQQAQSAWQRLSTAKTAEVPEIIRQAKPYRKWLTPILEHQANWSTKDDLTDRQKLHLQMAMLADDPGLTDTLATKMLLGSDEEADTLREFLANSPDTVQTLWEALKDRENRSETRLRAAGALASYDSGSEEWNDIAVSVASLLVRSDNQQLLQNVSQLRPVADRLIPSLIRQFAQPSLGNSAASALADYLSDDMVALTDLILSARVDQLSPLLLAAEKSATKITALFRQQWDRLEGSTGVSDIRSRANIAVGLMRLGDKTITSEAFQSRDDNTLRTNVIHRYGASGGSIENLLPLLKENVEPAVSAAALLAIGECNAANWSPTQENRIQKIATQLFEEAPDSGVHSAAEWLLRKLGHEHVIERITTKLSTGQFEGDRNWYITTQGHTMIRLDGNIEVLVAGSSGIDKTNDEREDHLRWVTGPFAISSKEVTAGQWKKYAKPDLRLRIAEMATERPSGPEIQIHWMEAASYCVWMDRQENLPRVESCFKTNLRGGFGPTFVLSDRIDRLGFQLPSVAHWVYAAAGNTTTPRYFGRDDDWLEKYVWCSQTARGSARAVGSTKPNVFGLFDVLGNAVEWTGTSRRQPSADVFFEGEYAVTNNSSFRMVGGSFIMPERVARIDSLDNSQKPMTTRLATGIRLMRMLSD